MTDTKNAANDFTTLVSKSKALQTEMVNLNANIEVLAEKEQTKSVVSEKTYLESIQKANFYVAALYADLLVYFGRRNPNIKNTLKHHESGSKQTSVAYTESFLTLINDVTLARK